MKRFLSILICAIFVCSFAGCGLKDVVSTSNGQMHIKENVDIPLFENNDGNSLSLDCEETLAGLTYMISSDWTKTISDEGFGYKFDNDSLLSVFAVEYDFDTDDEDILEIIFDAAYATFEEDSQDMELLDEIKTEVIGVSSERWHVITTVNNVVCEGYIQVFLYDYTFYIFCFLHSGSISDEQLQCFSQIIDSIEIKD